MHRLRPISLILFALAFALPACAVPVVPVTIVAEYPHDPRAFTQGLHWYDGRLFESTGLYGESTLREVDLESGIVLRSVSLDRREFGEDITVVGGRLIQLTWENRYAYVWDVDTFEPLDRIRYRHRDEGWGLTFDGESLITSDGSDRLRFIDPNTFAERRSVVVRADGEPVTRLNALQYIDGKVYANLWQTTRIAEIDPMSGDVIAFIELGPLVERLGQVDVSVASPNGIAYDSEGKRVFVTGKLWPVLFEVTWR
ncbi:MAG: glutaminyl-peptide cyclotransferase [Gammaproteobacteria bacterium]